MKEKEIYLVKQHYSDGLPYSEIYGEDIIAVAETEEIAKEIAKRRDDSILKSQFEQDIWDDWIYFRDDNYPDPDDKEGYACIFDRNEEYTAGRHNELIACKNWFKNTQKLTYSDEELEEKIKKQWEYEDNSYYEYSNCKIVPIKFYYE